MITPTHSPILRDVSIALSDLLCILLHTPNSQWRSCQIIVNVYSNHLPVFFLPMINPSGDMNCLNSSTSCGFKIVIVINEIPYGTKILHRTVLRLLAEP